MAESHCSFRDAAAILLIYVEMIEDGWQPHVTHVSGTSRYSIDTYRMIWGRFVHRTRDSSPIVRTEFLTGGITSCMNSRCAGALLRDSVSLCPLLPHFKKQPIWMDGPRRPPVRLGSMSRRGNVWAHQLCLAKCVQGPISCTHCWIPGISMDVGQSQ